MVRPGLHWKDFIAPLAGSGPHIALFLVRTEGLLRSLEVAVLTFGKLMRSLFMLFSVAFGDDLATLAALVVVSSASDLMHSNFTHGNSLLACRTNFRRFFCHLRKEILNTLF